MLKAKGSGWGCLLPNLGILPTPPLQAPFLMIVHYVVQQQQVTEDGDATLCHRDRNGDEPPLSGAI